MRFFLVFFFFQILLLQKRVLKSDILPLFCKDDTFIILNNMRFTHLFHPHLFLAMALSPPQGPRPTLWEPLHYTNNSNHLWLFDLWYVCLFYLSLSLSVCFRHLNMSQVLQLGGVNEDIPYIYPQLQHKHFTGCIRNLVVDSKVAYTHTNTGAHPPIHTSHPYLHSSW